MPECAQQVGSNRFLGNAQIYTVFLTVGLPLGMAMRMREYAVNADCAHMCEYADADENLIHIIHT